MNNKGFTLIEMLLVISLIAIISIIIVSISGNTLSLNNEAAYEITKNNIINATDKYLLECTNSVIECDLKWNENKTQVKIEKLIKAGYFKKIINPINNKDISQCLIIEVEKKENKNSYNINDEGCK